MASADNTPELPQFPAQRYAGLVGSTPWGIAAPDDLWLPKIGPITIADNGTGGGSNGGGGAKNVPRPPARKKSTAEKGWQFLNNVLLAVDTPRAVVASGLYELASALRGQGNASWDEFVHQIGFNMEDRIYGDDLIYGQQGEVIDGKTGGWGFSRENTPGWVQGVTGLMADFAYDPLTYIAPAGVAKHGMRAVQAHIAEKAATEISEQIGRRAAGELSEDAVARITQKLARNESVIDELMVFGDKAADLRSSIDEIARTAKADMVKVRRYGPSMLSDESAARWGIDKGLFFKLPGIGQKGIRVTSGGKYVSLPSRAIHRAQFALGDLLLGGAGGPDRLALLRKNVLERNVRWALRHGKGGTFPQDVLRLLEKASSIEDTEEFAKFVQGTLRKYNRESYAPTMLEAIWNHDIKDAAHAMVRARESLYARSVNEAVGKKFGDEGWEDLSRLLNSIADEGEYARLLAEFEAKYPGVAEKFKKVFSGFHSDGVEWGLFTPDQWVQGYFPNKMTAIAQDLIESLGFWDPSAAGATGGGKASFERSRTLFVPPKTEGKAGKGILGHETTDTTRNFVQAVFRADSQQAANEGANAAIAARFKEVLELPKDHPAWQRMFGPDDPVTGAASFKTRFVAQFGEDEWDAFVDHVTNDKFVAFASPREQVSHYVTTLAERIGNVEFATTMFERGIGFTADNKKIQEIIKSVPPARVVPPGGEASTTVPVPPAASGDLAEAVAGTATPAEVVAEAAERAVPEAEAAIRTRTSIERTVGGLTLGRYQDKWRAVKAAPRRLEEAAANLPKNRRAYVAIWEAPDGTFRLVDRVRGEMLEAQGHSVEWRTMINGKPERQAPRPSRARPTIKVGEAVPEPPAAAVPEPPVAAVPAPPAAAAPAVAASPAASRTADVENALKGLNEWWDEFTKHQGKRSRAGGKEKIELTADGKLTAGDAIIGDIINFLLREAPDDPDVVRVRDYMDVLRGEVSSPRVGGPRYATTPEELAAVEAQRLANETSAEKAAREWAEGIRAERPDGGSAPPVAATASPEQAAAVARQAEAAAAPTVAPAVANRAKTANKMLNELKQMVPPGKDLPEDIEKRLAKFVKKYKLKIDKEAWENATPAQRHIFLTEMITDVRDIVTWRGGRGESIWERLTTPNAAKGKPKPVYSMKMEFKYGKNARPGMRWASTFEAILRGERTSTSRSGKGASYVLKRLKVGDVFEATAEGQSVRLRVTAIHEVVVDGDVVKMIPKGGEAFEVPKDAFLDEWSKREGWSVGWGEKFFAKPGTKALVEYERADDALLDVVGGLGLSTAQASYLGRRIIDFRDTMDDLLPRLLNNVQEAGGLRTILEPNELGEVSPLVSEWRDALMKVGLPEDASEKTVGDLLSAWRQSPDPRRAAIEDGQIRRIAGLDAQDHAEKLMGSQARVEDMWAINWTTAQPYDFWAIGNDPTYKAAQALATTGQVQTWRVTTLGGNVTLEENLKWNRFTELPSGSAGVSAKAEMPLAQFEAIPMSPQTSWIDLENGVQIWRTSKELEDGTWEHRLNVKKMNATEWLEYIDAVRKGSKEWRDVSTERFIGSMPWGRKTSDSTVRKLGSETVEIGAAPRSVRPKRLLDRMVFGRAPDDALRRMDVAVARAAMSEHQRLLGVQANIKEMLVSALQEQIVKRGLVDPQGVDEIIRATNEYIVRLEDDLARTQIVLDSPFTWGMAATDSFGANVEQTMRQRMEMLEEALADARGVLVQAEEAVNRVGPMEVPFGAGSVYDDAVAEGGQTFGRGRDLSAFDDEGYSFADGEDLAGRFGDTPDEMSSLFDDRPGEGVAVPFQDEINALQAQRDALGARKVVDEGELDELDRQIEELQVQQREELAAAGEIRESALPRPDELAGVGDAKAADRAAKPLDRLTWDEFNDMDPSQMYALAVEGRLPALTEFGDDVPALLDYVRLIDEKASEHAERAFSTAHRLNRPHGRPVWAPTRRGITLDYRGSEAVRGKIRDQLLTLRNLKRILVNPENVDNFSIFVGGKPVQVKGWDQFFEALGIKDQFMSAWTDREAAQYLRDLFTDPTVVGARLGMSLTDAEKKAIQKLHTSIDPQDLMAASEALGVGKRWSTHMREAVERRAAEAKSVADEYERRRLGGFERPYPTVDQTGASIKGTSEFQARRRQIAGGSGGGKETLPIRGELILGEDEVQRFIDGDVGPGRYIAYADRMTASHERGKLRAVASFVPDGAERAVNYSAISRRRIKTSVWGVRSGDQIVVFKHDGSQWVRQGAYSVDEAVGRVRALVGDDRRVFNGKRLSQLKDGDMFAAYQLADAREGAPNTLKQTAVRQVARPGTPLEAASEAALARTEDAQYLADLAKGEWISDPYTRVLQGDQLGANFFAWGSGKQVNPSAAWESPLRGLPPSPAQRAEGLLQGPAPIVSTIQSWKAIGLKSARTRGVAEALKDFRLNLESTFGELATHPKVEASASVMLQEEQIAAMLMDPSEAGRMVKLMEDGLGSVPEAMREGMAEQLAVAKQKAAALLEEHQKDASAAEVLATELSARLAGMALDLHAEQLGIPSDWDGYYEFILGGLKDYARQQGGVKVTALPDGEVPSVAGIVDSPAAVPEPAAAPTVRPARTRTIRATPATDDEYMDFIRSETTAERPVAAGGGGGPSGPPGGGGPPRPPGGGGGGGGRPPTPSIDLQERLNIIFETMNLRKVAPNILTPQHTANYLFAYERVVLNQDKFLHRLLKHWQGMIRWQKVWQISSSGFVNRNIFGGVFNNALAGVSFSSYPGFIKLVVKASKGELSSGETRLWKQITTRVDPGMVLTDIASGSQGAKLAGRSKFSWFPLSANSPYPKAIMALNSKAEFWMRGTMMYDSLIKGMSVRQGVRRMYRFHFNYEDLTTFDQHLRNNIVPFWAWTKNNLPLQLEMLFSNPRPFARVQQLRGNLEGLRKEDSYKPAYFVEGGAWQLPFWGRPENSMHWFPDFPFRDLNLVGRPVEAVVNRGGDDDLGAMVGDAFSEPLSAVTPLLMSPLEWNFKAQVYKGLPLRNDRVVTTDQLSPGAIPNWLWSPLRATGLVQRRNGKEYISERDLYLVEKMMPVFATYRRFFSQEPKMQQRRMSKVISYFFGLNLRENSPEEQKAQKYVDSLKQAQITGLDRQLEQAG